MQHHDEGKSFGSRLRAHRSAAGLTQEELAERAGLSRRGIADMERGVRRVPYAHTLEQLRVALDLSDDEFASLVRAARHRSAAPEFPAKTQHNLPLRQTTFVGRIADLVRIPELLDRSPVVTLVGPGGVGKTRLALEVAEKEVARWQHGVWLVEVAALNDASMLPLAIGAVLGLQQPATGDQTTAVLDWLQTKRLLLVLDNCEHMVDACARFVSHVGRMCSDVRVLATSREVLGIDTESVHHVDPLIVHAGADLSAKSALESEAVRLFVDRAVAAEPRFRLTDANASAVAVICKRLDGVPLALEMTAARLRVLSVEDISRLLDQRFSLLTSGHRSELPRHRTLRALVDWSYDLLGDQERALFEQLSVFSGGWTLDAVEAVCSVAGTSTVEALSGLVDKSLVRADVYTYGNTRYRMLETLREYANERLRVRNYAEDLRRRHARFYADALRRWWGDPWFGEFTQDRLARIDADYSNVQSSLRWLVDHAELAAAQQLAGSLTYFWILRGRVEEGRTWLNTVLALADTSSSFDAARAAATVGLMQLEIEGGNRAAALAAVESNLAAIREAADPPTEAQALIGLGWLSWANHLDPASARADIEAGLALARAAQVWPLVALGRTRLAAIAIALGNFVESKRLLDENRTFKLGGGESLVGDLDELLHAGTLLELGDLIGVEALLTDLAPPGDPDLHPVQSARYLRILSLVRFERGDLAYAATAALQSLQMIHKNLGRYFTRGHLASPLELLARVAVSAGDHTRALRLVAAAESFRQQDAILRFPREQSRLDASLGSSRAALGPRAAAAASAAGRDLSVEEVVAYASSAFTSAYTTAYSLHPHT